jgi:ribulose-bisphosphate carboxylase large chain
MIPSIPINLSGQRLRVHYKILGDEAGSLERARDICLEQTVEFPDDLVPQGDIRDHIVGHIEALREIDPSHCEAIISYAVESSGFELTQLLNVVFGNSSIKAGIRVEKLDLPETLLTHFKGPRFGREGWRKILNVPARPLLCTALKPMGLPPAALAELAYQFALGGIDIIKDDHGLANQSFAPFKERVERCAESVARANRETGQRCIYMPNVTAPVDRITEYAACARSHGAGGLMIAPGIVGFDSMRSLADDDRINLPILSHPALQGSFVTHPDNGIAHFVIFGQLARLAGADGSIFPNFGGRFSFSREECKSIADGTVTPMAHLKPILPSPGGGMSLSRVPEMLELYGREVIFLIGGGLHKHGENLVENCRHFRRMVEEM